MVPVEVPEIKVPMATQETQALMVQQELQEPVALAAMAEPLVVKVVHHLIQVARSAALEDLEVIRVVGLETQLQVDLDFLAEMLVPVVLLVVVLVAMAA